MKGDTNTKSRFFAPRKQTGAPSGAYLVRGSSRLLLDIARGFQKLV